MMSRKNGSREAREVFSPIGFMKIVGIACGILAAAICGASSFAGAADQEIRIGHATNLSGVFADGGPFLDKGLKLAFSLSKYKDRVKFFLEDTQTKPEVAVQKAIKLYEKDNVHILVGPIAGHEAAAVSAVLRPKKKLLIEAFGANTNLVGKDCSPYTFLLGHTTYNVTVPMAPFFAKNIGKKVFLVGADYKTGRDIAHFFREAFEKEGGKVVGEFYSPLGTTEFAPYLSQIRNAKEKPDGIYGFYAGADGINFIRQLDDFGLKKEGYIYVNSIGGISATVLPAMRDAAVGHYDCFHTVPYIDTPENNLFMNAWQKAYPGERIEEFGMMGYDTGLCLIKALDAVGGDAADMEGLLKALRAIEYVSPRGKVRMGPNNGTIVPIYARKIVKKEGKYRHESTFLGHYGTPCGTQFEWGECKLGCPN